MGDYHDFALLVDVSPENKLGTWENALKRATPEQDMSVRILKPTLLLFGVKADFELLALERAQDWLRRIASNVDPSISLAFNAQPTNEVLEPGVQPGEVFGSQDDDTTTTGPSMPRL